MKDLIVTVLCVLFFAVVMELVAGELIIFKVLQSKGIIK